MTHDTASAAPWRRVGLAFAVLLLVAGAALFVLPLAEQGSRADIVFERASLSGADGDWRLDARADVQLPIAVRRGLDSGVPLDFEVSLELRTARRFWFDHREPAGRWRYRLAFYDLTRHYRLADSAGQARNYRSLLSALEGLGELRALPLPDGVAVSRPGARAVLRMRLDTATLPLPLQPLVRTSWRVRGEPFVWQPSA